MISALNGQLHALNLRQGVLRFFPPQLLRK